MVVVVETVVVVVVGRGTRVVVVVATGTSPVLVVVVDSVCDGATLVIGGGSTAGATVVVVGTGDEGTTAVDGTSDGAEGAACSPAGLLDPIGPIWAEGASVTLAPTRPTAKVAITIAIEVAAIQAATSQVLCCMGPSCAVHGGVG